MTHRLAWLGWAALGVSVAACGIDASLVFTDSGATSGSGGSTTATTGDGGDTMVSVVNSSSGVTTAGGEGGSPPECLPEEVVPTELRQLDMLVIFDRTGSMGPLIDQAKAQVVSFAQQSFAPWTRMSLLYHGQSTCSTSAYVPDFPMTPIPSQVAVITSSLAPVNAAGGSPWLPPLEGGLAFATQVKSQNPEHQVVAVLIIDSGQTACQASVEMEIAPLAAAALGSHDVKTYAVGLNNGPLEDLDAIASAGGTTAAVDLSGNVMGLGGSLASIRDEEIPCRMDMPIPSTGSYSPEEVEFRYGPGGSNPSVAVPRVADENACIGGGEGWYYDPPSSPDGIVLCPKTCETVKSDMSPVLEVAFTCPRPA